MPIIELLEEEIELKHSEKTFVGEQGGPLSKAPEAVAGLVMLVGMWTLSRHALTMALSFTLLAICLAFFKFCFRKGSLLTILCLITFLINAFRLTASTHGIDILGKVSPVDFCFVMASSSAFLLSLKTPRVVLAQICALTASTVAIAIINLHVFAILAGKAGGVSPDIELPAAISLAFFSVAVFSLSRNAGLACVLMADSLSARLARRLLATLVLGPPLLALGVKLLIGTLGFFSPERDAALVVTALTILFVALAWLNARESARSEAKQLTAENERDRLFALSLDLLCVVGPNGHFVRVNPAFTTTLGWTQDEMLSRPYLDFFHPDDRVPVMERATKSLQSLEPITSLEIRYLHKNGSFRVLSWNIIYEPNGFRYATGRDITDEIEARKALNEAKSEADRANAAKSEFLSRMSHELRTPLNAVIGYAQLLEMQSDEPKIFEASQSILKSGRHLLALINEVLDLARIEAGKMSVSIEPTKVSSVIEQALDLVRPLASDRGITMSLSLEECDGHYVSADRQRLVQVILNLLTNSIKYNRQGGRVEIRCLSTEDNRYRIEVSDTGCGLKEDGITRLFQPFERVGDLAIEGTGLGLALSQKLTRLMGGELRLVSTGEEGSIFAVTLPVSIPQMANHAEIEEQRRLCQINGGRTIRAVYIEDNFSNVELLERVFAEVGGVHLMPAILGNLGLDLVQEQMPDVVLLDLHLPDIPGAEVLTRLKANPTTRDIPVIVLSADATDVTIERLYKLGATAYLPKPIDLPSLFAEINRIKTSSKEAA